MSEPERKMLTADDLRRLRTRSPAPRRPTVATAPWLTARREACGRCEYTADCYVAHQCRCSRGRILRDPRKACPAGLWGIIMDADAPRAMLERQPAEPTEPQHN